MKVILSKSWYSEALSSLNGVKDKSPCPNMQGNNWMKHTKIYLGVSSRGPTPSKFRVCGRINIILGIIMYIGTFNIHFMPRHTFDPTPTPPKNPWILLKPSSR